MEQIQIRSDERGLPPDPDSPVHRVLVATDRSEGGDRAARWAAGMARRHEAELIVARIVAPGSGATAAFLEDLSAFAHEIGGGTAMSRVVEGEDPAAAIVTLAEDAGADVVVVGNSGMRGRREFLLGNVANRVTHAARCTTVVVQSSTLAEAPPRTDPEADPRRAERAAEILAVLRRHRLLELLTDLGTGDVAVERAGRLRAALEELGPTFSKLGQILSTRPDLLPAAYIDQLATLQSDVPPLDEATVVSVMEQEMGVPWEDVFSWIDPLPLAAGTIGQVHRARLADGARVVVKVQRPAAAELIHRDLALLERVVRGAAASSTVRSLIDIEGLFAQLGASLRTELDFLQEAEHLERMAGILAGYDRLAVPSVHRAYSTRRLLVMDEVQGVPISQAPHDAGSAEAARQLLASCFQQTLVEGFFHADPHPGNLMWSDEKIWMIDLGMVGELDDEVRGRLTLLLLAFWRGDVPFISDLTLGLAPSSVLPGVDLDAYERDLGELIESVRSSSLREIEIGPLLQRITEVSVRHRVPVPSSLAMVGKSISQVQMTVADLAPDLDPLDEAGRFFVRDVTRRMTGRADPAGWLYEAEKLRHRLGTIAETLAVAGGARPGRRLEVGFASERLEAIIVSAGNTVGLGVGGGLVLLGAAVAAASERAPRWVGGALGSLGTALTAASVGSAATARRRVGPGRQLT